MLRHGNLKHYENINEKFMQFDDFVKGTENIWNCLDFSQSKLQQKIPRR